MKIIMLNFEFPPIGGGGGNACLQLLRQFAQKKDLSIEFTADLFSCYIMADIMAGVRKGI